MKGICELSDFVNVGYVGELGSSNYAKFQVEVNNPRKPSVIKSELKKMASKNINHAVKPIETSETPG